MRYAFYNKNIIDYIEYNDTMKGNIFCDEGHILIYRKCTGKQSHFAHLPNVICKHEALNKSKWHIEWQDMFANEFREIIMYDHRADIKIDNIVLEFQHTYMSKSDIEERECFYTNVAKCHLIWIFDCSSWEFEIDKSRTKLTYNRGSKYMFAAKCKLVLDLGKRDVFIVDKRVSNIFIGYILPINDFICKYLNLSKYVNPNSRFRSYLNKLK